MTQIQNICRRVYRTLELSGYARIDLRLDAEGRLVLQASPENPNRRRQDFADAAKHTSMTYRALIRHLVNLALEGRAATDA